MTDDEAKRYESQLLGFGTYGASTWGDAPTSHLVWLHEQNEKLGAYLRSDRGQRRQED